MTSKKLTPEQALIVTELIDAQARLEKSDATFSREHLDCSASKWCRIKSGEYFDMVDKPEKVIDELQAALGRFNLERALQERFEDRTLVQTDEIRAVRKALEECEGKPLHDPGRCVVFLAPTGGGKTFLLGHLRHAKNRIMVEAREVWKRSYFYCVRDLCVAAGVVVSDTNSPSELEQRLLQRLAGDRYTILIDEGEFFGPQALNLVKLILNKTRTVILIAVIPEAYDRWNRSSSHEASQVRRRTHRVVRVQHCDYDVIEAQFEGAKLNGLHDVAVKLVATRASAFGHYELARRMVNRIIQRKPATVQDIERAIAEVECSLGL